MMKKSDLDPFDSLGQIQKVEPDPYLLTRIKARLMRARQDEIIKSSFWPWVAFIVLAAAINIKAIKVILMDHSITTVDKIELAYFTVNTNTLYHE